MRISHNRALMLFFLVPSISMSIRVAGQTQPRDTSGYLPETSVTILTNIDSSVVFIDTERKGLTPLSLNDLTPGTHHLVLQHPDAESWLTNSIADSIQVVSGQPLTLRYTFEPRYLIQSIPFDAEVVLADSVIGRTPLTFSGGHPLFLDQRTFTIRKQGFETGTLDIGKAQRGVLSITLRNLGETNVDQGGFFRSDNGQISKPLRLTLTLAGTVLAGTAAAYFKIKADDRYLEYRRLGTPHLLSQSQRLDTAAAIAFVATQIGFGLFMYFVLSD